MRMANENLSSKIISTLKQQVVIHILNFVSVCLASFCFIKTVEKCLIPVIKEEVFPVISLYTFDWFCLSKSYIHESKLSENLSCSFYGNVL